LYLNFQTETNQVVFCEFDTADSQSTGAETNIFYEVESSLFRTTHKKREVTLSDKELVVYDDDGKINERVQLSDIKGVEVKGTGKQFAQLRLLLQDGSSKSWNVPIGAANYWKRVFYARIHPYLEVIFKLVLRETHCS
jgi:hypothetical protein